MIQLLEANKLGRGARHRFLVVARLPQLQLVLADPDPIRNLIVGVLIPDHHLLPPHGVRPVAHLFFPSHSGSI